MNAPQKYTQNLEEIRARISEIRVEIADCRNALRPADEIKAEMFRVLSEPIAEFQNFQARFSEQFAIGAVPSLDFVLRRSFQGDEIPRLALGSALLAFGADRFVTQAMASADFPAGPRYTASERAARLLELARELYQFEIDEELVVCATGQTRRADCNAAAIIGLPLDLAEELNLIGLETVEL